MSVLKELPVSMGSSKDSLGTGRGDQRRPEDRAVSCSDPDCEHCRGASSQPRPCPLLAPPSCPFPLLDTSLTSGLCSLFASQQLSLGLFQQPPKGSLGLEHPSVCHPAPAWVAFRTLTSQC